MKKNYFIAILALVCQFAIAQVQQTSFRGAFAPAPTAMWTNSWTNFDPNNATYGAVTTVISADITSNVSWTKDKVYELNGLITVRNNATLTIQAGTVIRCNVAASALVITRGAKLNAIGTAAEPIVFTSKNAVGSRQRGDWGGIILLGNAHYNLNNGVNYIEGLSQNENTKFGGGLAPVDNDNSGTLKYVRIEFAGFVFAPNNELNGLTMGAVGSGTTIDYVQVSYSNDDSFEWFGGSVNCKHLVAFNGLDDDFDTDNGYSGYCQFVLGLKDPSAADISDSEGFESDNSNSATSTVTPYTKAVFTNCTLVGPTGRGVTPNSFHKKALRLRRSTQLSMFNSIILDWNNGLSIEDTYTPGFATTTGQLKFKNNIIAGVPTDKFINGASGTALNTWFYSTANANVGSATSSVGVLNRLYNATNPLSYTTITGDGDTTNVDYRPGTDASTGASFDDAAFTGLIAVGAAPAVTPTINYCKGVVASALNATMTASGVSLRWYTAATGGIASATAPVPPTTTVGTKSYWVAELDTFGAPSNRAKIDVVTAAAPLVALGAITSTITASGVVATAAVGPYVGTTTQLTYTVPTSDEVGVTSYYWTVPLGVNIISGQDTNSIVVNYNNVPAGLFKIGNITVQARNAGLCGGLAKTLAITAVLPAAPTVLKMTDALLSVPVSGIPTAVTSFAKYMGKATELTLTATPVAAATSYVWELPTGVNLLSTGTPTVTTVYYNVFPFTLSSNTAPSTAGNVYYKIVKTTYPDGTSISTGRIIRNRRNATGTLPEITAFDIELKDLTNESVKINPAYPIVSSTSNVIKVNFAGVTSANTYNYITTAATPVSTNVLRIGVKSRNGVGASVTANASALNPTTTSTAKLLTLTAVKPAAVATVAGQIVGLCAEGSYNYTMVASPLASSYEITAPAGSVVTSAAYPANATNILTTSDLTFTVVYPAGFVATTAAAKSIVIKSINGIASSATNKTVALSTVMAVPGVHTGGATFTRSASQVFTVPAVVGATEYVWTLADGAEIVSGQGTTTVEVDFAAVSVLKTTNTLKVSAKNSCGVSGLAKSILLKTPAPAARLAAQDEVAVSATEVYPNPASSEFNIDVTSANGDSVSVSVYSYDGSVVVNPFTVQLVEGSNTINQNIASLRSGIYFVRIVNTSNNEVIVKKLIKG